MYGLMEYVYSVRFYNGFIKSVMNTRTILNNRCWQLGESGLRLRLLRPLQRQLLLRDHGGKDFFLPTLTGLWLDAVIRAPAGYRLAAAPARQRADSTPKDSAVLAHPEPLDHSRLSLQVYVTPSKSLALPDTNEETPADSHQLDGSLQESSNILS